jgi:hypothetical protein
MQVNDMIQSVKIDRSGRHRIRADRIKFGPEARREIRVLEQEETVIVELRIELL